MTSPSCWSSGPRAGRSSSPTSVPRFRARAGRWPEKLPTLSCLIGACSRRSLMQLFVLFVLIVMPHEINRLRPYAAPKVSPYEVIYYSGDELPRTEDLGGAQSGATGRAGGQEAHHRTQTIHVARGGSLTSQVVDAPDLKLPSSGERSRQPARLQVQPRPASGGRPAVCSHRSQSSRQRDRSGARSTSRAISPAAESLSTPSCLPHPASGPSTHSMRRLSTPASSPRLPTFRGIARGRTLLKPQRDWSRIHARLTRQGAFHSGTQRQRDPARSHSWPRSLAIASADERRCGRASASFRAGARGWPQCETQPSRALRHRTAAIRRFRPRPPPAGKRRLWRHLANRGSSATNPGKQQLALEQHRRQDSSARRMSCRLRPQSPQEAPRKRPQRCSQADRSAATSFRLRPKSGIRQEAPAQREVRPLEEVKARPSASRT